MLTVKHTFYWNGLCIFTHKAEYPTHKAYHEVTLPLGGYFRLVILPSDVVMRPFGLQEDHFIGNGYGEGAAFLYKGWDECHLSVVVQDEMIFVALSKSPLRLEDMVLDYATESNKLAEYIPLRYAA